jgi:lysophospholipase L1-like esterase
MLVKTKRLICLALAGLILIGGGAAYLFFLLARPIGSGPAGPAVEPGSFAAPWTTRKVLLVGLGDSVTAGFGARKGRAYFDLLAKAPADDFADLHGACLAAVLPHLQVTNLSVSGSTSSEVFQRQLAALPTNPPEVFGLVVMTTGGNDLIHNYGRTPPREEAMYGATRDEAKPWIENFARRLDATLTQIESRFPGGCAILAGNIFDPTDGVGDASRAGLPPWPDSMPVLDAYNSAIRRAVAAHPRAHLVDVHQTFLGHGIHCTEFWRGHFDRHDPHYWYFYNLEDPNERGYDALRRLFLNELAKTKDQLK